MHICTWGLIQCTCTLLRLRASVCLSLHQSISLSLHLLRRLPPIALPRAQ